MDERVGDIKKFRDNLSMQYGRKLIDIHFYETHIDGLFSLLEQKDTEIERWASEGGKQRARAEKARRGLRNWKRKLLNSSTHKGNLYFFSYTTPSIIINSGKSSSKNTEPIKRQFTGYLNSFSRHLSKQPSP